MKNRTVWDKTNIGENYPGTTSPLTYSFIREAYTHVYLSFLKLLKINTHGKEYLFQNMLGYLNGEVYYNIDNWYDFIKMLPGYKYNKEFFEVMLNPAEKKPAVKSKSSIFNIILSIPSFLRLGSNIIFINKHYRTFDHGYNKLQNYFSKLKIKRLSNKELVSELAFLEKNFFALWGHTIMNDFRVMIFLGVYKKIIDRINPSRMAFHLKMITKKPESMTVIKEVFEISKLIKELEIKPTNFSKLKKTHPKIADRIDKYLHKYGERSFNELKLEQNNFIDKPDSLLHLINYYSELPSEIHELEIIDEVDLEHLSLLYNLIYKIFKNITISAVHKREEYRLKRAKVFNIANYFFKEMGTRLLKEKLLENQSDVYFLYKNEIVDTLNNHRFKEDLGKIIASRKKLLRSYGQVRLDRRVFTENIYEIKANKSESKTKLTKKVQAKITSPGDILNGEIILMPNLEFDKNIKGKILVTHATDPGWTLLFPLVKGLIIETGGLLSHASIVAREMGIPCAVLPNALQLLKNKDIINLNGETGQIDIRRK